ncbi:MAG: glycine zipper domain-containing protein [Planctomycetales bacterium]
MMRRLSFSASALLIASLACATGCQSPYHADRGAALGAGTGAILGAIIGEASDNPLAGAAIGAIGGGLVGGAVGESMDQVEARNRALIEAKMGQTIRVGSVTVSDVVTMTGAGVDDQLIINHVNAHGVVAPPSASDLVILQQSGVSSPVVAAMQAPAQPTQTVIVKERPVYVRERSPIIVHESYHHRPSSCYSYPRYRRHHHQDNGGLHFRYTHH